MTGGMNNVYIKAAAGVTFDADAQALIDADGGYTDDEQTAINNVFLNIKSVTGLYAKIHALYLMVGSTASQHKWNAVDPRDLDAAFRLTFAGTVTHSSTGTMGNGATGSADTHFVPATHGSLDNMGIGVVSYDNVNNAAMEDMGAADTGLVNRVSINSRGGGVFTTYVNQDTVDQTSNSSSIGLFGANRTGATATNRQKIGDLLHIQNAAATASSGLSSSSITLMALNENGTPIRFSNRTINCAWISQGLTARETMNLQTILNTFNLALGRGL